MIRRSEHFWLIALYGLNPALNLQSALNVCDLIANRLGLIIGQTELKIGEEKIKRPHMAKIRELSISKPSVSLSSLTLYPALKEFQASGFSRFTLSLENDNGGCFVLALQSSQASLSDMECLALLLASIIHPMYGFLEPFECPIEPTFCNPYYYATGVAVEVVNKTENATRFADGRLYAFQNDFWGAKTFLHAKLRDVYCFNIINNVHLSMRVANESLEHAIENLGLGTLSRLDAQLSLWKVPPSKRSAALEMLEDSQMLLSLPEQ